MNQEVKSARSIAALQAVREELALATAAAKCHACGCFHGTLEAMSKSSSSMPGLQTVIDDARKVLKPTKYDCLGCLVCFPAVAADALSEAFPEVMPAGGLCPTDTPAERLGWPPLPGEYTVLRYGASIAVCTLNSDDLAKELAMRAPDGLAIVGTMHTENLGIERVVRNLLANPNIRWLVLCGDDTRRLVGHLSGQSMESLFANGLDETQRIVGAKGKRPFLKNLTAEHVRELREQVQLVSMIGEQAVERIARSIADLNERALPKFDGAVTDLAVQTVHAKPPQFFKSDPAGFFVVYPDARSRQLVVEHYTNAGVLDCVVEGDSPVAIYMEIIRRRLVSQLDHAAYLGRELATAERSLRTGEPYVQDRAPGEPLPVKETMMTANNCGPGCSTCH